MLFASNAHAPRGLRKPPEIATSLALPAITLRVSGSIKNIPDNSVTASRLDFAALPRLFVVPSDALYNCVRCDLFGTIDPFSAQTPQVNHDFY
jgi:hypothetical protein